MLKVAYSQTLGESKRIPVLIHWHNCDRLHVLRLGNVQCCGSGYRYIFPKDTSS
jgi:hypothetical protein